MELNKVMRQGRQLSRKLECFRLSNLANYDPSHTSMKFTREYDEASGCLKKKVGEIEKKRVKLQEMLACF